MDKRERERVSGLRKGLGEEVSEWEVMAMDGRMDNDTYQDE